MALVLTGCVWAAPVFCAPAQVIIIRHGEKPANGNELNAQGFQRAQALVKFFKTTPAVTVYGTPVAIYAMKPKDANGSVRAIQTVTPLAQSLGLKINSDYLKDDLSQLVDEIMHKPAYNGRMVLICWEHNVIPTMVQDFGWTSGPTGWAGAVFDRAWVLNFNGSLATSFADVPEHVLPGDGPK